MKNGGGFPYYRLSTALNFEKLCLKRQKHTSCCQDRGLAPEQSPWMRSRGGQKTLTLQHKIITKQQGLRPEEFLQDTVRKPLHACRIKHNHPTPWHSPAGSESPLGCSLEVTRAKAHPTYTHKPSMECCITSPQDHMARAPLKVQSGSPESSKLAEEGIFALNLFCIISACANYINQQQQSLWWEGWTEVTQLSNPFRELKP